MAPAALPPAFGRPVGDRSRLVLGVRHLDEVPFCNARAVGAGCYAFVRDVAGMIDVHPRPENAAVRLVGEAVRVDPLSVPGDPSVPASSKRAVPQAASRVGIKR